jgi:hypothetical protein
VAGRRSALTTLGGKGLPACLGRVPFFLAVEAPVDLGTVWLPASSSVELLADFLATQGPPVVALIAEGVSWQDRLGCLLAWLGGGRLGLVRGTTCRVATSQVCGAKYAALTLTRGMSVSLTEAAVLGTISQASTIGLVSEGNLILAVEWGQPCGSGSPHSQSAQPVILHNSRELLLLHEIHDLEGVRVVMVDLIR